MPDDTTPPATCKTANALRFVTATSLFDGHDAAINIFRRMLQAGGAEVIHLGHNRSVEEVVSAAIQEDAHAVAVSSYQGGHVEYFTYMIDLLRQRGRGDMKVFGGGGGVIVPDEIEALHRYGVARIYSPEDGLKLGLQGIIADMMQRADRDLADPEAIAALPPLADLARGGWHTLARLISVIEAGRLPEALKAALQAAASASNAPVLGVTGTGGAGKSSLTDELIRRFRLYNAEPRIAVIAVDPTRRRTGGALLGDRIRMNAIGAPNIYMRSLATRSAGNEVPGAVTDIVAACKAAGFDLVIVETPGIGQGDAGIVPYVDVPLYVMTPEFGAATQLEKIDMLDFAEAVVINKFDRKGAADALRDVRKQVQRNRQAFSSPLEEMPVFGCIAARFNDAGVTAVHRELLKRFAEKRLRAFPLNTAPASDVRASDPGHGIVPPQRQRYLAEIAESVRVYHREVDKNVRIARDRHALARSAELLAAEGLPVTDIAALKAKRDDELDPRCVKLLAQWPKVRESYSGDEYVVKIRDKEIRTALTGTSLSGTRIRKVVLPRYEDEGEILRWLLLENVPGSFPYTAGVFAFKRENEDPTRMFAGEGDAFRTNARFKFLSKDTKSKRLSTAFDSVTLYGFDPDERPDIYGKVGNSGVSIATLDDLKVLYDGFDLCDPITSVSMTING
ncbi:MAG: methylmalonyl-CoA mutase family protein, partial [Rhodospirillaceae bacterium]